MTVDDAPQGTLPAGQGTPPAGPQPLASQDDPGAALKLPAALARQYVTAVRRRHPGASPREVLYVIEKQFLLALGVGGGGTGLLALRPRRMPGLLAVSAGHVGASGAISAFYLLAAAQVHGLSPAAWRGLLAQCSLGGNPGGVLEQHLGLDGHLGLEESWWSTALAYLPVSQVRLIDRVADRQLQRAAAKGAVSRGARVLPGAVATTLGVTSGRILASRVVSAARETLGDPPAHFPTPA